MSIIYKGEATLDRIIELIENLEEAPPLTRESAIFLALFSSHIFNGCFDSGFHSVPGQDSTFNSTWKF